MVLLLPLQSKDARCHAPLYSPATWQGPGEERSLCRPRKLELDYGLFFICSAPQSTAADPAISDDWRQMTWIAAVQGSSQFLAITPTDRYQTGHD